MFRIEEEHSARPVGVIARADDGGFRAYAEFDNRDEWGAEVRRPGSDRASSFPAAGDFDGCRKWRRP